MGWQKHQLDHIQTMCTSLQTDNHVSTSSLNFLQARRSFSHPTNSVKAMTARHILWQTSYKTHQTHKLHFISSSRVQFFMTGSSHGRGHQTCYEKRTLWLFVKNVPNVDAALLTNQSLADDKQSCTDKHRYSMLIKFSHISIRNALSNCQWAHTPATSHGHNAQLGLTNLFSLITPGLARF